MELILVERTLDRGPRRYWVCLRDAVELARDQSLLASDHWGGARYINICESIFSHIPRKVLTGKPEPGPQKQREQEQ